MVFEHMEEKEAVEEAALFEKNGLKFYSLLFEKIKDQRIRKVLKMLLGDEKKHLKVIEEKYFPEAGFSSDEITEEEVEIEKEGKKMYLKLSEEERTHAGHIEELLGEMG